MLLSGQRANEGPLSALSQQFTLRRMKLGAGRPLGVLGQRANIKQWSIFPHTYWCKERKCQGVAICTVQWRRKICAVQTDLQAGQLTLLLLKWIFICFRNYVTFLRIVWATNKRVPSFSLPQHGLVLANQLPGVKVYGQSLFRFIIYIYIYTYSFMLSVNYLFNLWLNLTKYLISECY